jgi:hypothetical protein
VRLVGKAKRCYNISLEAIAYEAATPKKEWSAQQTWGRSLDQHFQPDDTPQARSLLEGPLREQYGRVVYSQKTHQKCADILLERHDRNRLWQIILAAVTTAAFVGVALGTGRWASIAGPFCRRAFWS